MLFERKTVILAQILASKGMADKGVEALTEAYKLLQKSALFSGRVRTYQPYRDVLEEQVPSQSEQVQASLPELLSVMFAAFSDAAEWHLAREYANLDPAARATIELDGVVILADAPVPALLALEKQVVNLVTALGALPTLDPAHQWSWDAAQELWVSEAAVTLRTRKQPVVVTKAEATQYHPAQTDVFHEDTPVGRFTERLYAAKLTPSQKRVLLAQAQRLLLAIRDGQQAANAARITPERRTPAIIAFLTRPFENDQTFPKIAE